MFPFAFVLMSRKTQQAYEDVFSYINKNVFPLETSQTFTTDYEVPMRPALEKLYPNSQQIACYFHFTQAVKRNMSKMPNVMMLIKSDECAKSIYYRLHCLPLLPPEHIIDCFKQLRLEACNIDQATFRKFFMYFRDQWIKKVSTRNELLLELCDFDFSY